MVEVVHDHGDSSSSSMGLIFGIILAIALVFFLFYYFGRGFMTGGMSQPQINVPDRMDVNVNQPGN